MIDITLPLSKSRKRKSESNNGGLKAKKIKVSSSTAKAPLAPPKAPSLKLSVTLKLGPRPVEPEPFPCCLCVSMGKEGLLRVHDPPITRKDAIEATGNPKSWMAHDHCARIVPETWVDDLDAVDGGKEKVVFGVDGIVKDRWNLVWLRVIFRSDALTLIFIEMFCMHENQVKGPWCPCSMYERQMPKGFPR
jgi:hypothetical protein